MRKCSDVNLSAFWHIVWWKRIYYPLLSLEYLSKIQKEIQLISKPPIFLLDGQAVYFFRGLGSGEDEVIGI